MNFIQVGAMNCIWNNIKKSLFNDNKDDKQELLIKSLEKLEEEIKEIKESYNKLLLKIDINETTETTELLEKDIENINSLRFIYKNERNCNSLIL
ncbi:hypothetical protein [Spiroplasma endosymbiont of Danaus chrysippus]|uniref:hypothetical protein n=1 Tax=Spiroplasma endosymbiont of Danaus chrysippus TaxID=2691041 RepID=UPI0013C8107F|nr:hypothetical protein [Spiroplasma endosymbiont of Danaus chrysippus]CAB1054735.1 hypothetical protein [Spiroplasma endosymbiont of Danaus chrysippus]